MSPKLRQALQEVVEITLQPRFNLSEYAILHDSDPVFLENVTNFLARLWSLSEDEKIKLATYKAAELLNAVVQILERKESSSRVGVEKAAASRKLAREVIRNRCIRLADGESISLQQPQVRAVLDMGSRLFYCGMSDSSQWDLALALSTAQCIVLNPYLGAGLSRVAMHYEHIYTPAVVQKVRMQFIDPYISTG